MKKVFVTALAVLSAPVFAANWLPLATDSTNSFVYSINVDTLQKYPNEVVFLLAETNNKTEWPFDIRMASVRVNCALKLYSQQGESESFLKGKKTETKYPFLNKSALTAQKGTVVYEIIKDVCSNIHLKYEPSNVSSILELTELTKNQLSKAIELTSKRGTK